MSDVEEPGERAEEAPARAVARGDLEDGLRFNHHMEMQAKQRLIELSASLYALMESLVAQGVLPIADYEARRQGTMAREMGRARSEALVVLNDAPDKYALEGLPRIDCEARLHLCKARCCSFAFALSAQDLDERVVRWNYGRPYQIAHRPDGYCVHNREGTHQCAVYEHRPAVCRTYDCREDRRVWVDFEKRIPAP